MATTQEAVNIRRGLAQVNPQAFLPGLAMSLGAHGTALLGTALLGLGRAMDAAQAFGKGLRLLSPFLRALPQAFAPLAEALQDGYLRACRQAGLEPDQNLFR